MTVAPQIQKESARKLRLKLVASLFKDRDFVEIGISDKQRVALEYLTDENTEEILFGGAAGGGKAQPLDGLVSTPFGFKAMGDMKIGDLVSHPSGANTRVIAVYPQGKKQLCDVYFSDGTKVECCKDHLWYYWECRKKSKFEKKTGIKGRIATAEQIKDKVDNGYYNLKIPLSKPVQFTVTSRVPKLIDKISPYVVGVLLGDGGLTKQITFTSIDQDIIDRVSNEIPDYTEVRRIESSDYGYSIACKEHTTNESGYLVNPFMDELRDLGIMGIKSEYKSVPKDYFTSSIETRYALIQGLMDTDGTADERGHCEFSSSSKQLAEDVMYILRSLGYYVSMSEKETTHLPHYRLNIQGENKELLFHLGRKKERAINKPYNGGVSEVGKRIIKVEYTRIAECQCITVEAPDGLYITNDFTVTHNTWLGCEWLMWSCLAYPGSNWFIGRKTLKTLKKSTLRTFHKVCKKHGLVLGVDYKVNDVNSYVRFNNGENGWADGSNIELLDLSYKPSDPEYEDLGSTEFTGGWIEEGGEIHESAKEVLTSRIGRHLNDVFGIIGKLLITCNPKRNWMYRDFYKPWKEGVLDPIKKFVQSFVSDNNKIDSGYGEKLKRLTGSKRARLLLGDWEYDDDPLKLITAEGIDAIIYNEFVKAGNKYITADIALHGSDLFVACFWVGFRIEELVFVEKCESDEVEWLIRDLAKRNGVTSTRSICVDADGIGSYLKGYLKGVRSFIANAAPVKKNKDENYKSINDQVCFRLAKRINDKEFFLNPDKIFKYDPKSQRYKKVPWSSVADVINDELGALKEDQSFEGKMKVVSKKIMKQEIGHSPDYLDAFKMREFFELQAVPQHNFQAGWA